MQDCNNDTLSSLWAKQLLVEFQDICWSYRINLRTPAFEISKAKKLVGSWHADTRTITISSFLILNNSWTVTLNVLKHEMAHQICTEIFKDRGKHPHGENFKQACRMLCLPKEYCKTSSTLPAGAHHFTSNATLSEKGQQFLVKVEKLLALGQSSNEHEASLAMQKANSLIEKYNLNKLSKNQPADYTSTIINKKKKRIEAYQRQICTILQDFFYVKIICSYLYDPQRNQSHKTIELLGTHENVTIAEYCYYFLENQLSQLWSVKNQKKQTSRLKERNSYYLGVLKGFHDKLLHQRESNSAPSKAVKTLKNSKKPHSLMVTEDKRLNDYISERFPRLKRIKRRGPEIYLSTFNEGIETGKEITFHKGITKNSVNNGKLIE